MSKEFDAFERQYETRMRVAMDILDPAWTVTGYKGHNTHDGVAFVANLRHHGKVVGVIEDAGVGGGPNVFWTLRNEREPFMAEARRLFPEDDALADEDLIEALLRKAGL